MTPDLDRLRAENADLKQLVSLKEKEAMEARQEWQQAEARVKELEKKQAEMDEIFYARQEHLESSLKAAREALLNTQRTLVAISNDYLRTSECVLEGNWNMEHQDAVAAARAAIDAARQQQQEGGAR